MAEESYRHPGTLPKACVYRHSILYIILQGCSPDGIVGAPRFGRQYLIIYSGLESSLRYLMHSTDVSLEGVQTSRDTNRYEVLLIVLWRNVSCGIHFAYLSIFFNYERM